MRISDWSSDVCSSDLSAHQAGVEIPLVGDATGERPLRRETGGAARQQGQCRVRQRIVAVLGVGVGGAGLQRQPVEQIGRASCREKSVSVRVDLGGRRIIKKKNKRKDITQYITK